MIFFSFLFLPGSWFSFITSFLLDVITSSKIWIFQPSLIFHLNSFYECDFIVEQYHFFFYIFLLSPWSSTILVLPSPSSFFLGMMMGLGKRLISDRGEYQYSSQNAKHSLSINKIQFYVHRYQYTFQYRHDDGTW